MSPRCDNPEPAAGRYDSGQRRQGVRRGRERGVWLFVPAEELAKAGIDPYSAPPFYRLWATKGGGLFGRLYRER